MSATKPDVNGFRIRALRKTRSVVVGALQDMCSSVIRDTPVLTGKLRANWRFTAGQRDDTPAASLSDPTSKVVGDIESRYTTNDAVYYFTNPMPYANVIEYGYSAKAPQGMLRINMARFKGLLRQRIK